MDLSDINTIGRGLARPEGVMAIDDGTIIAADARGCCARIEPDGRTASYGDVGGVPNGICMDTRGNCIIANIGNGQVQSLAPDGTHTVLLTEAEGRKISTPNFPFIDSRDRLWVSNSTDGDLEGAIRSPVADGCIALLFEDNTRVVADGLFFANGIAIDAAEQYLYVAETTRRAITRFSIGPDGNLSDRRIYGPEPLGPLGYPDGIAFDEAGNLWVTFPAWGAVGYITPDETLHMVIEDPEKQILRRPTNICFGGKDRKTAYIGSLEGDTIPYFRVEHSGEALVHQK